jgi:hypothetical protein
MRYSTLNRDYSLASKKNGLRMQNFTAFSLRPALIWSAQTVAEGMDFCLSALLFVPKYCLKQKVLSRILDFHSGFYEEVYFLGYDALKSVENQPTAAGFASGLLYAGFLLDIILIHEDGGDIYLRKKAVP